MLDDLESLTPTTDNGREAFDRENADVKVQKIVEQNFPERKSARVSGGYMSAVYILENVNSEGKSKPKSVLKIGDPRSIRSEVVALTLWKEKGANVPAILSKCPKDSADQWFEMEYVAPQTELKNIDTDKATESLFNSLRLMHEVNTHGWGTLQESGLGKFSTANELVDSIIGHFFSQEPVIDFLAVNKPSLVKETHTWLDNYSGVLTQDIIPAVIHNDLNDSNWLIDSENNVVIIDPVVQAGDPMQDIAHLICLFKCTNRWSEELRTKLIKSYFTDGITTEQINRIKYYQVIESIVFMAKEALVGNIDQAHKYLDLFNTLTANAASNLPEDTIASLQL